MRGLAFLHNAPGTLIDPWGAYAGSGPSAGYPLLGADDLPVDADTAVLAQRLQCEDLEFLLARKQSATF